MRFEEEIKFKWVDIKFERCGVFHIDSANNYTRTVCDYTSLKIAFGGAYF